MHEIPAPAFAEEVKKIEEFEARESHPVIQAEVNALNLPIFVLQTKTLRTIEQLNFSGAIGLKDNQWKVHFRTSHNQATLHPGRLSRSFHMALLSLIHDCPFPVSNPIKWTWGNLCRRMQVYHSGRMIEHLKTAIRATAGLSLHSHNAICACHQDKSVHPVSGDFRLYERIAFTNERLTDGTAAECNHLWLSEWYLSNLNASLTIPLDYDIWKLLDSKSPVASRLYELLLVSRCVNNEQLRISYPTLSRILPVKTLDHFSNAERQLSLALKTLENEKIIKRFIWQRSERTVGILTLMYGQKIELETGEYEQNASGPLQQFFRKVGLFQLPRIE